jgi:hypothetical protein
MCSAARRCRSGCWPGTATAGARFAALAQWYELTWGNVVDNATTLRARCQEAGLELAEETSCSWFTIMAKR